MKGFIRKLATVGLVVLILALPITTFAQTIISNEAEEHILSELRRANIPNAAVAVMQNGETSYIFKDSTQDTLFQIGSVTKSFTGFGVLLLEDMGLLSVSDPVNRHLPWFDVRYNDIPVTVTIYNLLQHRSGLTSDERLFPMAKVT
ncbi:MAG: serine hydrolase, partial [Defluviitaleaceae bacterium]|nr:serine hydrolase [Defluviitaleaceae bacterium]